MVCVERPLVAAELSGISDVAQKFHLCDSQQSAGRSRIANDEHRLSITGPGLTEAKIIRRRERFVVFVDAKNPRIEIPPRICEVVGISAKVCGCLFRREDEPHILEPPVPVE